MKIDQAGLAAEGSRLVALRQGNGVTYEVMTPGEAVVIRAASAMAKSAFAVTHCEMAFDGFDRKRLMDLLAEGLTELDVTVGAA